MDFCLGSNFAILLTLESWPVNLFDCSAGESKSLLGSSGSASVFNVLEFGVAVLPPVFLPVVLLDPVGLLVLFLGGSGGYIFEVAYENSS